MGKISILAGLTPCAAAGEVTLTAAGAGNETLTAPIAGIKLGDVLLATMKDCTSGVYLSCAEVTGIDTATFTISNSVAEDVVIAYLVLRG